MARSRCIPNGFEIKAFMAFVRRDYRPDIFGIPILIDGAGSNHKDSGSQWRRLLRFDLAQPGTGQSVAWLMNATSPLNTAALPSDPSWKIAASADFNGDGMTDLIWSNASTGQVIEWLMNGTTVASSTLLLEDPFWKILEAADLNGDGMANLVLYNASTGQTVAWIMNGTTITRWSLLLTDPNWKVIATADFNGDRMADLVWYNETPVNCGVDHERLKPVEQRDPCH